MDKKLSFSISSKLSSSKANRNPAKTSRTFTDNDRKEDSSSQYFVTEFDSNDKTLKLNHESSQAQKRVIAPIENEYRPEKRMKNLDLPLRSALRSGGDLDFEAEASVDAANEAAGGNISYGLNIRQSGSGDDGFGNGKSKEPIDNVMLKKLKDDMNRLPDDDETFDQFEEVPVEGYGAALMAGYGWKDGMGIGKSAKQDVKVVEFKKWAGRGGLGAFSDVDVNDNKKDAGKNGIMTEKERKSSAFPIGKVVRIVHGRDTGLKGRVVEEPASDGFLVLTLSRSKDQVRVSESDVAELGSSKEENCLQKMEQSRHRESSKRQKKDSDTLASDQERKTSKRRKDERKSRVPWLRSHIKVRIISENFKGGRLYLKKGEVLDVVGPTTCDISMDGSKEIIQGVEQDILETALPRSGGNVIVLSGKHKGMYGSLVKKDVESETGVVQEADSHELLNVGLEQIAEYVEDPSYIGY